MEVSNKNEVENENAQIILASQRDNEIFFNALINPPEPNDALVSATLFSKQEKDKHY